MTSMLRHPLSAIFSAFDLQGADLDALAADIKAYGLRIPITTYDGMILDGWNRSQACAKAKVKPTYAPLPDEIDPSAFVISSNLRRRHLAAGQISALALSVMQLAVPRSKLSTPEVPSTRQVEKDLGVSHGTAVKVAQVAKANDPAIVDALAQGKVSLDRAAEVARMPQEDRKTALEAPRQPASRPAPPVDDRDARIAQLTRQLTEANAELEDLKAQFNEQGEHLKTAIADNEAMERVINADDRLTAMIAERKRFMALNQSLESRNKGLANENFELGKATEKWQDWSKNLDAALKENGIEVPRPKWQKGLVKPVVMTAEDDEYNRAFEEAM